MIRLKSNKLLLAFPFFFLLICVLPGLAQRPDFTLRQSERWQPAFADTFSKALYKTRLEIGKNKLSGVMFLKRTTDSTIRLVYANEIGMTYFDLELSGTWDTIHAIFPSMDRKAFLKILLEDLRILLFRDMTITKLELEKNPHDDIREYRTKSKRGTASYFADRDSKRLLRHKSARNRMQRAEIRYTYGEVVPPVKVYIVNPTIRLHIYMDLLSE